MIRLLVLSLVLALAACGKEAPKPQAAKSGAVSEAPAAPAAAVAAPEPAKPNPDRTLAERVKKALDGGMVQAAAVDVTASAGVVSLWGAVSDPEERSRAARIAAEVEGVQRVDNKLVIVKGS
jgi:hypothetical protein